MTRFPARWAKKRLKRPEHEFQKAVAQYLNAVLPADAWWTSIDHAGEGRLLGALRKARGVKSGLADVWVVYKGMLLCIELKSKQGVLSQEQLRTAHELYRCGVTTYCATTLEALEGYLSRWHGIPLRATLAPEPAAVKGARGIA